MTEPSESTLWQGTPALRNWWPLHLAGVLCAVAAAPLFVLGLGPFSLLTLPAALAAWGGAWLKARSDRYTVTSQRVIWERGILSRERSEVELKDIRHLNLKQSLGQRLLRLGDVEIESAGGADIEISIRGVASPSDVMETIRRARLTPPSPAGGSPSRQS